MDKFYLLSSTKKVKNLEAELVKELKDLKDEIEDADSLFTPGSKSFSSLPIPRDADYFRNERKVAFRKALKVRRAMPLTLKSEVMKQELQSATMNEFTKENIGIILHQFFTDRAQSLAFCKTMHMLRWARICRDSKAIDALYPDYLKRLDKIIKEQQDAVQRSKRLSLCRDLGKVNTSSQYVNNEDLLIYTRWLICQLHSVKHIHSFIRTLEWLPSTRQSQVQPETDGTKTGEKKSTKSQDLLRSITRKLSTAGRMFSPMKRNAATFSEASIPAAPNLSHEKQKPIVSSCDISTISAACGGGLASNEVSLNIPVNDLDIASYASVLDFLLSCYGIQMHTQDLKSRSDEMDMLHLVLRKFKSVYYDQEQLRQFPTYDTSNDILADKPNEENLMKTFKKSCDWKDFIQLKPKVDCMEKKNMTMLREKNVIDELLRIHSQFFHVSDSQKALSCLREHANCLSEQSQLNPVSVTTHKTGNDTSALWNKIFDYTAHKSIKPKKDPLGFDIKLSNDDLAGLNESELDLSAAVEMLGLEDDDEKKHPLVNHGTYLAYLALRLLRIRDLQRTCLAALNYFRSVERSLTIDDGGLVFNEDGFKLKKHSDESRSSLGIGSHQYMHNTPTDFSDVKILGLYTSYLRADEQEFLQSLELENQDDYYSMLDGRIHVQDSKGYYVIYDVALQDLKEIERQLLFIGSHFIAKHHNAQQNRKRNEHLRGNNFDLASYSHQDVDRFGVLLDLWTNETAYLENKRKLVSCHYELYQHVFDPKEKRAIAQIITDIVHERPRFDYSGSYFVQTYRNECCCLRLRLNIIESIANKQVELQREYLQKVNRENEETFGMPLGIIPVQNISVMEARPALRHVYLLEFHPSLALLSKVTEALNVAKQEFERIHKPKEPNQIISLERRFYEVALEEYQKLKPVGQDYSYQLQRDLFSETFIEDPLFVCTFGQSSMSMMNLKEKKRSVKAEKEAAIQFWCKLLQIITLRHRLVECCDESGLLSMVYKQRAKELGFDECHLYMRAVSFEFAQKKPDVETKPISTTQLIQNDSWVDRFTPNNLPLAVQELDEKHIGSFSLRTQEGLLQLCQDPNIEKLRTTLLCQIVHKNLVAASLFQIDSCLAFERKIGTNSPSRTIAEPLISAGQERNDDPFTSAKLLDAWRRKLQESFVSVQIEKFFLRNRMLNKFLDEKAVKGVIMNNIDEVIKMKRQMVGIFCDQLHERSTLHVIRSQIISYVYDMRDLLSEFPKTRDSHFIFGKEEDAAKKKDSDVKEDPTKFSRRPRFMISADGKYLANLWYLPHYKEVLLMFNMLSDESQKESLTLLLRLLSALFEICQYLCAHAKLGSSQARLGSKKLQFSGVTADWGGTEGIGAELREIQQQINNLASPKDPCMVASFLEKKRDVMFFEFDIAVSRSVRSTFLSSGNEKAFKSISACMHSALRELSENTRPSVYSSGQELPEPLFPEDTRSFELCPWKTFMSRYGTFPLMNKPVHKIEQFMLQCLAGLENIDRHVVNGEILSLSLLLEDALVYGPTDIKMLFNTDKSDNTEHSDSNQSRVASPKESSQAVQKQVQQRKLSTKSTPMEAIEFLHEFLFLHSILEQVKDDWACRKLGIPALRSSKHFRAFTTIYKSDVLQIVYKQIAAKQGKENEYDQNFPIDDNEPLAVPSDVGEYEIKARQLIRLLESLECSMINDVIRRVSREHTLVIAERSRDDPNLPTDLWKKSSMKENIIITRPHLVEDFHSKLMSDHLINGDTIVFNKEHLEKCLVKLASDTMQRERQAFESYAGFYEGILKKQHQSLYLKEQELKQARSDSQNVLIDQGVEVDCLLADKCRDIILEITALRSKVSEMTDELADQERELREKFKQDYNSMVIELFNNAFSMKNRFEQFRSCLYDDVFDCLGDVRKLAVQSMKKLREKSGQADAEADSLSQRLIRAEQLREAQWESKNLLNMILKLKALGHWNKTKNGSKSLVQLGRLQQDLSRSKREALEISLVQDEKETLLKQEISSLRRALNQSEKDCHILRKKLSKEHKVKMQRSNTQLQEAFSQRKIDLAKTANIEKLLQELEEKEEKLRALSELTDRDNSVSRRSKVESKRALKQVLQQLSHERSLKLDAFDRCDDLRRQVDEYEEHLEIIARPMSSPSHHASCFPSVPGGRTSPQRALISARPHTHAAVRTYQRSKSSRSQNPQQNQWWTSPVSHNTVSEGAKSRLKTEKISKSVETEKANIRLKKKLSETLLTDYDGLDDY